MSFSCSWRRILAVVLIGALLSACSFDPNVRKQKYFQSGESYFENGKYSEAAIQFTNAIKIDPAYAEAHFQLAECYLKLQQPDRALPELARTIELQPADYRPRLALANLLILGRDFDRAQEQTDWLLKMRPNQPDAHATASSLLAAQGNISGAIAEMQKTIALAPGRWEPYLSLALLQLKNNQPDAAESSFKKVIELNPKAMQARLVLGNYYQSNQRMKEAEQQFRDALALNPQAVEPREAIARLYLEENRKADAEEVLKQAQRDMPNNPDCLLALSNFYYMTGEIDKSVAEYDALYHARPKDMGVKKKYIQLLIQVKRYDEARNLDNEILKSNPKDDDALVYQSQIQISNGDVSDAVQTLQTVIKDTPNSDQAHYALGIAFQRQGHLDRAENEFREALRLNSNLLGAQRAIADVAMRQGDMDTLRDAANQMIRLQPASPEGYALHALANINLKQYSEAEEYIGKAISVAPESAYGYVQLGNLRYLQGRFNDASRAYQDALTRNADSTDALRGLVNTCVAEKQVDKAVAAANKQIAKSPNNSDFYDLLGTVLFHSKRDLAGAQSALEKSVALDHHNLDALIKLCEVLATNGQIDQAIAKGQQFLSENAQQPSLLLLMGKLYESNSDWKKAEYAYRSALAINSQNPAASIDLARSMLHTGGNLDDALSLVLTAWREIPNSPGIVDTLGWIYYQKGSYSLAVNYLQKALSLQQENRIPDNPDIHYHLGMALARTGQAASARLQFDHVLKIYPNYRNSANIKQELIRLK